MAGSLKFKVLRMPAELVSPAAPTPRELKLLSDVDDQAGLRFHIPAIHFFRRRALNRARDDPMGVLRDTVARALVHYYPLAGRLRELEGRKLAVNCTGEGVLFTEAHADVTLEQFRDDLQPPFPCGAAHGAQVRRGRPHLAVARAYLVSDVSRSGIRELDFGWGKPAYAGPAKGGVGAIPGVASFLIACRNARGEEGIVVPVCLPGPAMDKFVQEMAISACARRASQLCCCRHVDQICDVSEQNCKAVRTCCVGFDRSILCC